MFAARDLGKIVTNCASFGDVGDKCDHIGKQCSGFVDYVDGVCIDLPPRDSEPSLAEVYAQLDAIYNDFGLSCDGRPCAPGLARKERSECDVPAKIVKKGGNCFATAASMKVSFYFRCGFLYFFQLCVCTQGCSRFLLFFYNTLSFTLLYIYIYISLSQTCITRTRTRQKCEGGTVCNTDIYGYGVRQCGEPFDIDDVCSIDAHCKSGLKCSADEFSEERARC